MVICIVLFFSLQTFSSVFLVVNVNDSGTGSLRQAISDANQNLGYDTIDFNISGNGPFSIQLLTNLPLIFDSLSIDGFSQPNNAYPNFIVEIKANSNNTSIFNIAGSCITIRGLKISSCTQNGNAVTIDIPVTMRHVHINDNLFTDNANNIYVDCVGIFADFQFNNNTFSQVLNQVYMGIHIVIGDNQTPINQLTGLSILNNTFTNLPNVSAILIDVGNTGGTTNVLDNSVIRKNMITNLQNGCGIIINSHSTGWSRAYVSNLAIDSNTISNTACDGIYIGANDSIVNFSVRENIITNCNSGIYLDAGGTGGVYAYIQNYEISKNTISQNAQNGITIVSSGTGGAHLFNRNSNIDSNTIYQNGAAGIQIYADQGCGTNSDGGNHNLSHNTLFQNHGYGVEIVNESYSSASVTMKKITLSQNSIYDNDSLGIKTQQYVTLYSNPVIPAPHLDSILFLSGNYYIYGTISAQPSTQYKIETFSNNNHDLSGFEEGETYINSDVVLTNGAGLGSFVIQTNANLINLYISATATDLNTLNTSQFSIESQYYLGIDESSIIEFVKISPNPFLIETSLKTNKNIKEATLMVYNSYGQQVKQIKNISGQTITLHRDNLPSGIYLVRLISQNNKILTTNKLVITD